MKIVRLIAIAAPVLLMGSLAAKAQYDSSGLKTGGTSPVTVTFNTVFHAKPICTCGDETAAVGACKVVANSNGATAVVTTTATDSFTLLCVGK